MNCKECNTILALNSKSPITVQIKNQRCYGCGTTIISSPDFYYCSLHPNYMICCDCRLCKNGHFMQKVVFLIKINPLYMNNTYGCDICAKTKQVTDDGIWHCNKCGYDVCEVCLP